MEQYKEKLRLSLIFTAIGCFLLWLVVLLGFLSEAGIVSLTPLTGDSHWHSRWRGFLSGAAMGVMAMMLIYIISGIRALKDEKKLKKRYIREHDERQLQICTAARAAASQIMQILGLAAGIAAGYFSIAVGITILACTVFQCLVIFACKLYYGKKF